MEHRFPLVLGKDFAGQVDAIGPGVDRLRRSGDRVFGTVTKPYVGDGSFAEYVTVPAAVGAREPARPASRTPTAPPSAWPRTDSPRRHRQAPPSSRASTVARRRGDRRRRQPRSSSSPPPPAPGCSPPRTPTPQRELVTRLGADAIGRPHRATCPPRSAPDRAGRRRRQSCPPRRRPRCGGPGPRRGPVRLHPGAIPGPSADPDRQRGPGLRQPHPQILDQLAQRVATGQITVTVQQVFPLQRTHAAGRLRPGNPRQTRHHHRLPGSSRRSGRPLLRCPSPNASGSTRTTRSNSRPFDSSGVSDRTRDVAAERRDRR